MLRSFKWLFIAFGTLNMTYTAFHDLPLATLPTTTLAITPLLSTHLATLNASHVRNCAIPHLPFILPGMQSFSFPGCPSSSFKSQLNSHLFQKVFMNPPDYVRNTLATPFPFATDHTILQRTVQLLRQTTNSVKSGPCRACSPMMGS